MWQTDNETPKRNEEYKQQGTENKKLRRRGKNKKLRKNGLLIKWSNCGRQGHNKKSCYKQSNTDTHAGPTVRPSVTILLQSLLGHLLQSLLMHSLLVHSLLGLLLLQHNPVMGLLLQLCSLVPLLGLQSLLVHKQLGLPLLGHERQQKHHLLRAEVGPSYQLREAISDMWLDFFFDCDYFFVVQPIKAFDTALDSQIVFFQPVLGLFCQLHISYYFGFQLVFCNCKQLLLCSCINDNSTN